MIEVATSENLTGKQFGRWVVQERVPGAGAAMWRCRCQCGTVRVVAARNLKAGASTSCGCLARERARACAKLDLTGQRYGKLVVIHEAGPANNGESRWHCLCDCGVECDVLTRSLRNGKRTSCGCDSQKGKSRTKNIAGQKFAMLTALYPTPKRGRTGSVIWHCRCDCGNETDVSYERLLYSTVISCGCMRKKCDQEIKDKLTHVDGTSIDILKNPKRRSDNSTGITGVYRRRGKYEARIVFQGKTYYLGRYSELNTAAEVRRQAEEAVHREAVRFYEQWKRHADENPDWAEKNPISFHVKKTETGEMKMEILPRMDQ